MDDVSPSLVAVGLREAALDSPTFRASVRYAEDQIQALEKHLESYVRMFRDFTAALLSLEESTQSILAKSIPSFLTEHLVGMLSAASKDAETRSGLHLAYNAAMGPSAADEHLIFQAKVNDNLIAESLSSFLRSDIKEMKESRRQFHHVQERYDNLLNRYHSQSKSKESSALREDAFQLFESRREYLQISLAYSSKIATFRASLNTVLVTSFGRSAITCSNQYAELGKSVAPVCDELSRILKWNEEMSKSHSSFEARLLDERTRLEEHAIERFTPPRDLGEYAVSTLVSPGGIDESELNGRPIKQGWLFVKTANANKSTRVTWVRRWVYIKDGMIGWLIPGQRGVEEGEKIGVLLCNAKTAVQEDRRFCFEVLTKNSGSVFQAETEGQLAEWLKTLELAKRAAVDVSSPQPHASMIIPPFYADFAAPDDRIEPVEQLKLGRSASEKEPVHTKISQKFEARHNKNRVISTSGSSLPQISQPRRITDLKFQGESSGLAPNTLISPPVSTELSGKAVVAASYGDVQNIPSGGLANYWGSTNWGLVSTVAQIDPGSDWILSGPEAVADSALLAREKQGVIRRSSIRGRPGSSDERKFPTGYPAELEKHDAQFRALFPGVRRDDFVLFVFRAAWRLNHFHHFSGRIYVTMNGIYLYSYCYGTIMMQSYPFSSIQTIKAFSGHLCDYLLLKSIGRKIKIHVYLDSIHTVQQRMDLILRNSKATDKLEIPEIFNRLRDFEDRGPLESADEEQVDESDPEPMSPHEDNTFAIKRVVRLKLPSEPMTCGCENHLDRIVYDGDFEISAKAMFHLMFGDNCRLWSGMYSSLVGSEDLEQQPWKSDGKLSRRAFQYNVGYEDSLNRKRRVPITENQCIEKRDEHLCYVITDSKHSWNLPHAESFILESKFCITHISKFKCKLKISVGIRWLKTYFGIKSLVSRAANTEVSDFAAQIVLITKAQVVQLKDRHDSSGIVRLFGAVGSQTEPIYFNADSETSKLTSDIDPTSPRLPIRARSTASLIIESLMSFGLIASSSIVQVSFTAYKATTVFLSAQWLLIAILGVSILVNLLLGGKSTVAFWSERSATVWLDSIGVKPNMRMSKAVYLQDLDDMIQQAQVPWSTNSTCFRKFQKIYIETDLNEDAKISTAAEYYNPATRRMATQILQSRQRLGALRHDVLVSLRMIAGIEKTLIKAEWENWLKEESLKCEQVSGDSLYNKELGRYCGDCLVDLAKLNGISEI
ncbi:putative PH domain-containing protein [Neolecta irregularis DAH-3]|uniref:Putative PH domain-containing protein n=1 Tax=Neolecta irregularis (strain DAH-3) TaxID=1198029 RepID=A0A1U7LLN7_NEOID|nr:putative PH domain-containing protein [Neolecta irregularis DAH-3]|eukprot:OLL23548.1 putative PH domain-containing protein [Neolecta irregularis DAH-3]